MDRRRKLFIALQVTAVAVFLGFLGYALRDSWGEAGPRLRDADVAQLALAFGLLAVYYLLFVLGWLWILRALHINISYRVALQAEMVSMLAKYVPGGVWTPAARVVALRRHGVTATPTCSGRSRSRPACRRSRAFSSSSSRCRPWTTRTRRSGRCWRSPSCSPSCSTRASSARWRGGWPEAFGASELPPIRHRTLLALIAYYAVTWVFGGLTILYQIRAGRRGRGHAARCRTWAASSRRRDRRRSELHLPRRGSASARRRCSA